MSDSRFPSGRWTGYYNYSPGERHRMRLTLTFDNGNIHGDGVDDVGTFRIRGKYDTAAAECHWTKSYDGAHDVYYRGFREGKGIWGTWEISLLSHGGFHIWPMDGSGEGLADTAEEFNEVTDAVGKELAGSAASPQTVNRHRI